jgi:hypothetical protein
MAVRYHVRCPVCGTPRPSEAFGIRDDDTEVPDHKPQLAVQAAGRGGRFTWDWRPLPRPWLVALRDNLRGALARVEALLGEDDAAA